MYEERGCDFREAWTTEFILDLVGYKAGTGISQKRIAVPSCSGGDFLGEIAKRLAEEILSRGYPWTRLGHAVSAYEEDPDTLESAIERAKAVLVAEGCPGQIAEKYVSRWGKNRDFVLNASSPVIPDELSSFDYIVGNPPCETPSETDGKKVVFFPTFLKTYTASCDLSVAFIETGLDVLRSEGSLCFMCPDRWLRKDYGRKLRNCKKIIQSISLDCGAIV